MTPRLAAAGLIAAALAFAPTGVASPHGHPCLRTGPGDACRGADLRALDLRGHDLRSADLRKADLRGARLSGARLRGARLDGATLRGAQMHGTDMRGARLRHADLTGARIGTRPVPGRRSHQVGTTPYCAPDCGGVNLSGADFAGADLTGADLTGATLIGTNLRNATLTSATLLRASLAQADLGGASLSGANLAQVSGAQVNLQGADLTSAVVAGARFVEASMQGAIMRNITTLGPGVDDGGVAQMYLGADLFSSQLAGADFTNANLTNLASSGSNLAAATLTGAYYQPTWVLRAQRNSQGTVGLDWPSVACSYARVPLGNPPPPPELAASPCSTALASGGTATFALGADGRVALTFSMPIQVPPEWPPYQTRPVTTVAVTVPMGFGLNLFGTAN